MHSHRARRNQQGGNPQLALLTRAQLLKDRPIHDVKTGFIQHPAGYPIEIKRKPFWDRQTKDQPRDSRIGIIFDSTEYHKPGSYIEISIPLPNRVECFTGQVVLVRQNNDQYETGLWLFHTEDASRARIVEQLCHIEVYMQEKKYREGPYNLNPDRVAREWISKYASEVPSL